MSIQFFQQMRAILPYRTWLCCAAQVVQDENKIQAQNERSTYHDLYNQVIKTFDHIATLEGHIRCRWLPRGSTSERALQVANLLRQRWLDQAEATGEVPPFPSREQIEQAIKDAENEHP